MKTIFFENQQMEKKKISNYAFFIKNLTKKRHFSSKIDLIKLKKNKFKIKKNLHKKLQKLKSGKIEK